MIYNGEEFFSRNRFNTTTRYSLTISLGFFLFLLIFFFFFVLFKIKKKKTEKPIPYYNIMRLDLSTGNYPYYAGNEIQIQ